MALIIHFLRARVNGLYNKHLGLCFQLRDLELLDSEAMSDEAKACLAVAIDHAEVLQADLAQLGELIPIFESEDNE